MLSFAICLEKWKLHLYRHINCLCWISRLL